MATNASTLFAGIAWETETAESRAAEREVRRIEAETRDADIRRRSPDGMTAVERALAMIRTRGEQERARTMKSRARRYIEHPHFLNAIALNLSQMDVHDGLRLVEQRLRYPIGDNPMNLLGARLAGRWLRRIERNGRLDEFLYGSPLQAAE